MFLNTHSYVISRRTCDCQEGRLGGRGGTETSNGPCKVRKKVYMIKQRSSKRQEEKENKIKQRGIDSHEKRKD